MRWTGWASGLVGFWLIVSPWILGFRSVTPALWSSIVAGVAVILVTLWREFGGPTAPKLP